MKLNTIFIQDMMNARNLKQKDLAKRLRTSPQMMSYYFRPPLTIHKAQKISKSLSTKISPVTIKDVVIW